MEGTFPRLLFYENKQIERFVYPRKIMNTGDFVLYLCRPIKEIIIPEEVEILGGGALQSVDHIKRKSETNRYRPEYYSEKPMPKERYTIPDMVKELGKFCYGYYPYKTIEIPNSVEKFGNGCFAHSKLESFIFPPKVTVIQIGLFSGCKRLKSVKMHNNITFIKDYVFEGSGIEELIIPESVTSVGRYFLKGAGNLKKVYVKWQIPPLAIEIFDDRINIIKETVFFPPNYSKITLYVPKGTKAAYQNSEVWKNFGTIIEE